MLIDDIPTHYWRLNDSAIPTDLTIYPEVGSVDGTYIGSVNRFQPGPDRLIGTNSSFFQSGGAGYIDSVISNQFQPILDTSDSYSMEFWFNCGSNNRGMLIDCTEEQPNEWNGIRVYLNSKSNAHSPGNLQFSQSSSVFINSLDVDGSGDRYNQ